MNSKKGPANRLALVVVLGVVTAFDAMAIDMYLPAFADIGASLRASDGAMQTSLSVFLGGLALGQLFYGPLADRFGRRAPLAVGIILFVAASLYIAAVEDMTSFMVGRFLQGIGGASGLVIPRAIVADLYDEHQAARIFSMLIQVMMIAPIAAPLLGGGLLDLLGWRAIFLLLAAIGMLTLLAVMRIVPETLEKAHRQRGGWITALLTYRRLLGQADFVSWTFSGAFAIAGLFAYIGASSFIYVSVFGLSPSLYSLVFAANAVGMVLVGYINVWLLNRWNERCLLPVGLLIHCVSLALMVGLVLSGRGDLYAIGGLLFLAVSSLSLVLGNVTSIIMAVNTGSHGSASSLFGVLQYVLAGVMGAVMGALNSDGTLLLPLLIMLICALGAMATWWLSVRIQVYKAEQAVE